MAEDNPFSDIEGTLKRSAAALREAGIPFLLGGSLASWARGGPETRHDLDLMIKEEDVEAAMQALERAGMRRDDPPEEWLVKAWDGDVLVDLIFHPKGMPITDEVIARGEEMAVLSMEMRVMALEDVIATKLLSISEHHLRYETLLAMSRALREKVDWHQVRERTGSSPFARAFFVLLDGLGIVSAEEIEGPARAVPEPSGAPAPPQPAGATVRVLTDPASGSAAPVAG